MKALAIAALISRSLGSGETARAKRLTSLVLLAGGVIIGIITLLLWWLQLPIFTLLGADETALTYIESYWGPQLLSAWLAALVYFIYSVKLRKPLITTALSNGHGLKTRVEPVRTVPNRRIQRPHHARRPRRRQRTQRVQ